MLARFAHCNGQTYMMHNAFTFREGEDLSVQLWDNLIVFHPGRLGQKGKNTLEISELASRKIYGHDVESQNRSSVERLV
jgi:hypothetical protein